MQISEPILLSSITIAAATLLPQDASAALLWRIGVIDDHAATWDEADDEFVQGGAHQEVASYDVTTQIDATPSLPHRLNDSGAGTATSIEINFDLAHDYGDDQLVLTYGRFGSETDTISLDGVPLATVSVAEAVGGRFVIPLPEIDAGPHTLAFDYMSDGADNGHAIDFFSLREGSSTNGSSVGSQWWLGTREGQVAPSDGSLELGWTGAWVPYVTCHVDVDCGSPDAPNIPRGLSDSETTWSNNPQSIDIDFTLAQSTVRGELMLKVARYGSELDEVFVDGVQVGAVSALEGRWILAKYIIPDLLADEHTVTVSVVDGSGSGVNGQHHLDFLSLNDL